MRRFRVRLTKVDSNEPLRRESFAEASYRRQRNSGAHFHNNKLRHGRHPGCESLLLFLIGKADPTPVSEHQDIRTRESATPWATGHRALQLGGCFIDERMKICRRPSI